MRTAVALALTCCAHQPSAPEAATYALVDGVTIYCAAVAVGPRELVTAAHCVNDRGHVELQAREDWRGWPYGWRSADVVLLEPHRDLGYLLADEPLPAWAEPARQCPREAVLVSHGLVPWQVTETRAWALWGGPAGALSVYPVPGDSGSGVWTSSGRLLGIVVARAHDGGRWVGWSNG